MTKLSFSFIFFFVNIDDRQLKFVYRSIYLCEFGVTYTVKAIERCLVAWNLGGSLLLTLPVCDLRVQIFAKSWIPQLWIWHEPWPYFRYDWSAIRRGCYFNSYFLFVIKSSKWSSKLRRRYPPAICSYVQPKTWWNASCQKRFKAWTLLRPVSNVVLLLC